MAIAEEPIESTLNLGSFLIYSFLGIATVFTIYRYLFEYLRFYKLIKNIPSVDGSFVLKNLHHLINTEKNSSLVLRLFLEMINNKGKVVKVWTGRRLIVALFDPRDIELILGSNVHLQKSPEYRLFEPWLGDGLLISNGNKWRSHRKMIAPTFHQSILKTFVPIFNKNAQELVDELRENTLEQICDIHDYMSGTTVDVLLETVMGVKKTKEAKSSFEYAKAVMDMCSILHFRHVRLWMHYDFIFSFTKMFKEQSGYLKTIHTLTDKVIKKKKENYFQRVKEGESSLYNNAVKEAEETSNLRQEHNFGSGLRDDLDDNDESIGEKKRLAFLDFMVEASQTEGNKLSDEEIREEVNTIMFEGHDTTAAASSFFICVLGVHQDIQEKVYQEVTEILQDSDRPITFNDTLEMKYLERVLLETLRMYPPVPVITRIINEEVKLASADYVLPKSTTVVLSQYKVHRDPTYYPDPEKFDPDRFLPEKCQDRHYYSYIPFSAGPRSCVGRKYAMLKLKILLATIVRNFKIKSVVSEKEFELQADIILKRADGFRVVLTNRK